MERSKSDLVFTTKPDWVSWKDVMGCFSHAHEVNNEKGLVMPSQFMTPEELEEDMKGGTCFVALKDKQVIGTASVKIIKRKQWWNIGKKVGYLCHAGIIKEYQGSIVFLTLYKMRDKFVKEQRLPITQLHTSEYNDTVIKLNEMRGYKLVQYAPTGKDAKYYSVTLARWENGCPYPDWVVKFMYYLSMVVAKTFFTSEYKFRFWFH